MGRIIYPCDLMVKDGQTYTDTEAWIDLLVNSDGDSVQASLLDLQKRWRWTQRHVRTFLEMLKDCDLVDIIVLNTGRIITFNRKKQTVVTRKSDKVSDKVFDKANEISDNKLQEQVTRFLTRQVTSLTATEIPLISIEELEHAVNTGKDANGDTLHPDEKAFAGFCMWMRKNAPYCADPRHLRQLKYQEFLSLRFNYKYESKEIVECIMSLENDKEHRKKYSILYNTLINWLKLRHGDRRE